MATRGRPRAFDPDAALRKALDVFWERGYEGTSMNDLVEAMGIASASIYAAFGSKAELFRRTMGLYAATRGEPPRRALRERPTARGAIEAMLGATADEITRPDDPHYCLLILAAPTGAVENHEIREFLAGGRRAMQAEIARLLARGVADGDLVVSPARVDAIARYYTTVVQGLSIQARDGASRAELETVIGCAMAAWDALAAGPPGPDPEPGYGTLHCWLAPPLQAHRSSWVPSVLLNAGSSRQPPEAGLTSSPLTAIHCWLAPPLQVHSSISVPLAWLAPVTSRHWPLMPMVPLLSIVHCCEVALSLQSHICTLVPGAAEPALSSMHSAVSSPAMTSPVGVAEPTRVVDRSLNWSVW